MFDEEMIPFTIVCYIIIRIILGIISSKINKSKGYDGGFAWGFWLGVIGIIVVACRSDYTHSQSYQSYQSNTTPDPLSIEAERVKNEKILSQGGWRCPKCYTVNPSYVSTCKCGMNKQEAEKKAVLEQEENAKKEKDEQEIINLQKLKSYKELLDSGIITQEEFEKKKSEILNL